MYHANDYGTYWCIPINKPPGTQLHDAVKEECTSLTRLGNSELLERSSPGSSVFDVYQNISEDLKNKKDI